MTRMLSETSPAAAAVSFAVQYYQLYVCDGAIIYLNKEKSLKQRLERLKCSFVS